ncbi:MAG: hypothetical protein JW903_03805 [Clostridia bacterium]|nr:hypothetical protein [Clostridia bacterium]
MDIGSRIEMFTDTELIESMDRCSLRLNAPIRKEKVMTFDKPWESMTSGYITVIPGGPGYIMYYRGASIQKDDVLDELTCVAFSEDGINFTRPNLGLIEYENSVQNNIILKSVPECHNFTPFLDSNPETKTKYKAVGGHERLDDTHAKLYGLCSDDGIHWKRLSDDPILTDGMFDSQNVVFYDNSINKYRCYYRYFDKEGKAGLKPYEGIRSIKSSLSSDMQDWEPGIENSYDVSYLEEFYTNATARCPGAEHFYMSFPKRFIADRKRDFYTDSPAVSDAVFMTSRDGFSWNRTFREAWVRPGLDRKNWVNRNNMPALGIIETSPEEFSMYISENYRTKTNGVRRLSIRKYGFASAHADYDEGWLMTKPFRFMGDSLYINYSTSAAGFIIVEMLDENFTVLFESEEIYGDEIFEKVNKDISIGRFEGQNIRLRFRLRDADLYAFRFKEDDNEN